MYGSNTQPINPTGGLLLASGGNLVVQDVDLRWKTDGGGNVGAAASGRPLTVYVAGSVVCGTNIDVNTIRLREAIDIGSGLGTTHALYTLQTSAPIAISNRHLTDGASAKAVASVYDRGAASITNANTIRIHSFGWTNNSDVYAELVGVIANGSIYMAGAFDASSPPAAVGAGQIAYFSNGAAGNPCLAVYDGSNWLRCDTLAAVSPT